MQCSPSRETPAELLAFTRHVFSQLAEADDSTSSGACEGVPQARKGAELVSIVDTVFEMPKMAGAATF